VSGAILELQRAIGNRRVAALLSGARNPGHSPIDGNHVVQRLLDYESFQPRGKTSAENMRKIGEFATTVSKIVDQVYADLLAGQVKGWTGAKLAAFIDLVNRANPMAVTHAGNVVEERVYSIMKTRALPLKYTEQFSERMGGASKPDIVIHLPDGKEALIDITSDRFHILKKAGGWETSDHYVYLAEAYFPSVTTEDVGIIRTALEKGGIDRETARRLKAQADAERLEKMAARIAAATTLREEVWAAGSFSKWCRKKNVTRSEGAKTLREYNIQMKGMPPRPKGPKAMSTEGRKRREGKALKLRKELRAKKVAEARAKATGVSETEDMVVEGQATQEIEEEARRDEDLGSDDEGRDEDVGGEEDLGWEEQPDKQPDEVLEDEDAM
jgi:hypothetical protein